MHMKRSIRFGAVALTIGAVLMIGGMVFPDGVMAAPGGVGAAYDNPLGYNTVDAVLTSILRALQTTIVLLAIVFIVIGGILYITSAGDQARMGTAKGAFTAALIGLAIAVAAPTFLKEIYKILGATDKSGTTNNALSLAQILNNTLQFLLGVAGTIALIAMVIGGIMYLTAGADESRIDTGKKIFKAAIIGTVIIMAALVIVRTVAKFFI